MAYRALPAGTVRRRAFFGLLDADGWTWAFLKGLFWFIVMLLLLGYLPDRFYYWTVSPTVSIGANVFSPINLCPPGNEDLPCPAPRGAIVPWQGAPAELALPGAVTAAGAVQSGTNVYLVGGRQGQNAVAQVLRTEANSQGNLSRWEQGPALPAPRADAGVVSIGGTPYVIGGLDQNGAPTDTVFQGKLEAGALTGWQELEIRLPRPVSAPAVAAGAEGVWVAGGRTANGLSAAVYHAALTEEGGLGEWKEESGLPLPEPRAAAAGVLSGEHLYVIGGEGPNGPSDMVFRLSLTGTGEPRRVTAGGYQGWAYPATDGHPDRLPEPRSRAMSWSANSAIYLVGGLNAEGRPARTTWWATPSGDSGDLGGWKHLDQSDLPDGRAGAAVAVVGSIAFLLGGDAESGNGAAPMRASLAPAPPFFQLGLAGATIPGLAVKGDVGQQLGSLNAAMVGTGNFILLVLIGIAFSHRQGTRRVLERVTRGRYRSPREDEYFG